MKKLLTFTLIIATAFTTYAQDASSKKLQAGLTLGGAMSFNTPQTVTIDSKLGGTFLVGMTMDWNFSTNIGLTTGLEFEFDKFKTFYNDSVYFDYNDKNIFRVKDFDASKAHSTFLLEERKHNSIYLTIPVMLKFQSSYLGYFRYFGRFGIRNSFNLMTRATNEGKGYDNDGNMENVSELKDMTSKGTLSFYKGSVGITGGAEYNITGNTVLVAELGYFYGFSNVFNQGIKNTRSLYNLENGSRPSDKDGYYQPSLKQGQLLLKVSVLF